MMGRVQPGNVDHYIVRGEVIEDVGFSGVKEDEIAGKRHGKASQH